MTRAPSVPAARAPLPGPPPPPGRRFETTRRVRLADVTPEGRVRADALARYLQDVATDDARQAGIGDDYRWVVRRTLLCWDTLPRYEDELELVTWCSGSGAAWAERRTRLRASSGGVVEASALWVCLDPETLRPCPLGGSFFDVYGEAARRRVRAALDLDPAVPPSASRRTWPLRLRDYDLLGHLTNAVAWELLEEETARLLPAERLVAAEVEYREAVQDAASVEVVAQALGTTLRLWVRDPSGRVALTAAAQTRWSPQCDGGRPAADGRRQ